MIGSFGRVNASAPLAVLQLTRPRLTLRIRPRFLALLFGTKPVVLTPREVTEIYPMKASFGGSGVGVQPRGAPVAFFWVVGRCEPILSACADAGFNVTWAERRRR